MSAPLLHVEHLTRVYDTPKGPLKVLDDVSFSLRAGETISIIGPSGSGKSTLLSLCAGLDRATSGTVLLGGRDVGPMSEDQRAALRNELVGFVFQNFKLLPTLTALENVMVPAELRGIRDARARAEKRLQQVGLGDRMGHYPSALSGGEQQRVALARAFVNDPRILFADEPTGNLDYETAEVVEKILFDLNRDAGTALVVVTHHLHLAQQTQRILELQRGRAVERDGLVIPA